jgi:hypothetical protein
MPVIKRPKDAAPLFGERAQVVFGPGLVQLLRQKQERDRKSASSAPKEDD